MKLVEANETSCFPMLWDSKGTCVSCLNRECNSTTKQLDPELLNIVFFCIPVRMSGYDMRMRPAAEAGGGGGRGLPEINPLYKQNPYFTTTDAGFDVQIPSLQLSILRTPTLQPVCMSVCMSACLHVWLHVYMSVSMFVCMSVCMFVCMSVCMLVRMSACLHVCLHVYMSFCMPACMSACLHVCLHVCMSVCMSACLSACLTVIKAD